MWVVAAEMAKLVPLVTHLVGPVELVGLLEFNGSLFRLQYAGADYTET